MLSTTGDPVVLETIAAIVPAGFSIELDFVKFFKELVLKVFIVINIPPNLFLEYFR
jgi:hypothetical protein